jgi:anaerobic magnesium-protoporphyrin IX monomethyl ester cyclase
MLRIGFIQVISGYDAQWLPSLIFGTLKAYLHKHLGDSVEMVRLTNDNFYFCDIIAISTTSQDYGDAKAIVRDIKMQRPNVITVIGGHHVTWLPWTLTRDFDFGVIGEGEETFLQFVRYVMNGRKEEELYTIPGLTFWREGGLVYAPPQPLIEPLDRIPFAFREPQAPENQTRHIFTARGCPYKCKFCSSSAFWKKTRFHSAD